jgi:penicillin-binding protein 1A
MYDRFKTFLRNRVWHPLSIFFMPVTNQLAAWFLPIGLFLQPYKERFDDLWANFYADHPHIAVWIRRGTKLALAAYLFYFTFAIGLFGEIPTVESLKELQTLNTSEVYTADSVVIGKFYKENRKDISYDDLPKHLVDALVSTEDERYWDHSGVDFRAFGRVLFRTLLGGDESSGGGSTISQQLVKNIYGRKQFWILSTPINKVREMLIARRLERAYDKKNLLSFYLNTVPFGGNVFGVEMAAMRFFNKPAIQLKIEEGAVIVGMLKANTTYNPRKNPEKSLQRRNLVLSRLSTNRGDNSITTKISQKQLDSLKKLPLKLNYQPVLNRDNMASYFKDYIRTVMPKLLENLKKEDGSSYDIYQDGLKIYTSIDSKMQVIAEQTVTERMAELQRTFDNHWSGEKWWGDDKYLEDGMRNSDRYKRLAAEGWNDAKIKKYFTSTKIPITLFAWENGKPSEDERTITLMDSIKYYFRQLNTGFMAMDPKTGLIKAWVGGTDFNFFQYDHVRARRQVGSTFKPIVYAKAIQAGMPPCEYVENELTAFLPNGTTESGWKYSREEAEEKEIWIPHNSDDSYSGSWSLQGALTNSVNVVSAKLIHRFGYRQVKELAKNMGVTSEMQNDMSIALGTADISLFDMMKVYGTFAARGKRPEPIAVLKITTRDGKVIADFTKDIAPQNWPQVLTTDHADIMTKMMQSVVDEGTASRLRYKYNINNNIAGKTGTTQSHADGWFMCYTPNIVCGAWVGGVMPVVRFRDISVGQGAYTALPICGLFLNKLYATPQYAALKNDKFPTPAKWIVDSMDCEPRHYTEWELARFDSIRMARDTNYIQQTSESAFPDDSEDNHDLRGNDKEDDNNKDKKVGNFFKRLFSKDKDKNEEDEKKKDNKNTPSTQHKPDEKLPKKGNQQ